MYNKKLILENNLYDSKRYMMWLNKNIVFDIDSIRRDLKYSSIEDYEARELICKLDDNKLYNERTQSLITHFSNSSFYSTNHYNDSIELAKLRQKVENGINDSIKYEHGIIENFINEIFEINELYKFI